MWNSQFFASGFISRKGRIFSRDWILNYFRCSVVACHFHDDAILWLKGLRFLQLPKTMWEKSHNLCNELSLNTQCHTKMSLYKFVKGSRLFMQGTREQADYDNVADSFNPTATSASSSRQERHLATMDSSDGDEIHAVHTMRSMAVNGSSEWERSSKTVRSGGVKTRSTRTVRKVTTITKGEQTVKSESVMKYDSDFGQKYPAISQDKKSLKFRVIEKVRWCCSLSQIIAATHGWQTRNVRLFLVRRLIR